MYNDYRLLQLTNTSIGAVAVNGFMPLGSVTRRISCPQKLGTTFDVTTTGADVVYLNEPGYYKITYNASIVEAGTDEKSEFSLIVNGTSVYSANAESGTTGASVNITLPFVIRVFPNCVNTQNNLPTSIQVQVTGDAITDGTSNLIIERVYC